MSTQLLLALAGSIGIVTAIIHGVLMQRLMINPILMKMGDESMSEPALRLVTPLMHLSTVAWFMGGVVLLLISPMNQSILTLILSVVVALHYFYGALFNFIGTRGRHPGWILLSTSVILIVISLSK